MSSTTTIVGRYRLEGRLGIGGMSTVHLAFDERLERYVAVKLLAEHLADDPTFVSRFRREALAAARLVHPNIVQVFDFGLDESSNQHYIVMEHVAGHSCAELLRDLGHLDVGDAVEIVAQACAGLDYAHRHGVVHRDVKPGNLLVSGTDVVKLADFGIARATGQSSITQVGSVLGTAAYLAPEQARGEEPSPRADIYSLGVVAYQLIAGRLPYEAASLSELALKQQRDTPRLLSALNSEVTPGLAQAVAMALAIDPTRRPPDAAAFAAAVRKGARSTAPQAIDAASVDLPGRAAAAGQSDPSPDTAATRVVRDPRTRVRPAPGSRERASRSQSSRARSADAQSGRAAPSRARSADLPPAGAQSSRARSADLAAAGASSSRARSPNSAPAGVQSPRARSSGGRASAQGVARRHPAHRRALRRLAFLLALILVFIASVVVAVAISTSTSQPVVHYRHVMSHDLANAIKTVQSLIRQYSP
jgi:serine/threonine-protein kinase